MLPNLNRPQKKLQQKKPEPAEEEAEPAAEEAEPAEEEAEEMDEETSIVISIPENPAGF